jgi:hypothetical protein
MSFIVVKSNPMARAGMAFVWIAIAALVNKACSCGPVPDDRVDIPNSNWFVASEIYSCSAADAGELLVFATNIEAKRHIELVDISGVENINIEYLGGNHIQITLPNLIDIRSQVFSFGPYQVTYKYLPSDDPKARANYLKWLINPEDPAAKKWHENTIESQMHSEVPHAPESGVPRSPD